MARGDAPGVALGPRACGRLRAPAGGLGAPRGVSGRRCEWHRDLAAVDGRSAQQAALNAGARVELVVARPAGTRCPRELDDVRPEVVLFCGGTDSGQERIVLDNAEAISGDPLDAHFVVACNERIAERVGKILGRHGARVDVVANVMPRIGSLEVEPARAAISEAFVRPRHPGQGAQPGDRVCELGRDAHTRGGAARDPTARTGHR